NTVPRFSCSAAQQHVAVILQAFRMLQKIISNCWHTDRQLDESKVLTYHFLISDLLRTVNSSNVGQENEIRVIHMDSANLRNSITRSVAVQQDVSVNSVHLNDRENLFCHSLHYEPQI
ncbi:hypothetical protein, partial [Bartonella sp. CL46QHWL]|uniref:hypothetical protein n=1 Tax=Bartonella sp. CL46QHWL TaxID=3243534 RepID=UPI0035D09CAE